MFQTFSNRSKIAKSYARKRSAHLLCLCGTFTALTALTFHTSLWWWLPTPTLRWVVRLTLAYGIVANLMQTQAVKVIPLFLLFVDLVTTMKLPRIILLDSGIGKSPRRGLNHAS